MALPYHPENQQPHYAQSQGSSRQTLPCREAKQRKGRRCGDSPVLVMMMAVMVMRHVTHIDRI
ncbi:hypothetical protein [Microvirga sp. P5_D2]|jgi:hypothetical protein